MYCPVSLPVIALVTVFSYQCTISWIVALFGYGQFVDCLTVGLFVHAILVSLGSLTLT